MLAQEEFRQRDDYWPSSLKVRGCKELDKDAKDEGVSDLSHTFALSKVHKLHRRISLSFFSYRHLIPLFAFALRLLLRCDVTPRINLSLFPQAPFHEPVQVSRRVPYCQHQLVPRTVSSKLSFISLPHQHVCSPSQSRYHVSPAQSHRFSFYPHYEFALLSSHSLLPCTTTR